MYSTTVISLYVFLIEKIKYDELGPFTKWAFGVELQILEVEYIFILWNKLHGSEFMLNEDSTPEKDVQKMIALWRKSC